MFSVSESHAISVDSVLADITSLSESAALAFSTTEADSVTMGDSSVELRLNGFLVGRSRRSNFNHLTSSLNS